MAVLNVRQSKMNNSIHPSPLEQEGVKDLKGSSGRLGTFCAIILYSNIAINKESLGMRSIGQLV